MWATVKLVATLLLLSLVSGGPPSYEPTSLLTAARGAAFAAPVVAAPVVAAPAFGGFGGFAGANFAPAFSGAAGKFAFVNAAPSVAVLPGKGPALVGAPSHPLFDSASGVGVSPAAAAGWAKPGGGPAFFPGFGPLKDGFVLPNLIESDKQEIKGGRGGKEDPLKSLEPRMKEGSLVFKSKLEKFPDVKLHEYGPDKNFAALKAMLDHAHVHHKPLPLRPSRGAPTYIPTPKLLKHLPFGLNPLYSADSGDGPVYVPYNLPAFPQFAVFIPYERKTKKLLYPEDPIYIPWTLKQLKGPLNRRYAVYLPFQGGQKKGSSAPIYVPHLESDKEFAEYLPYEPAPRRQFVQVRAAPVVRQAVTVIQPRVAPIASHPVPLIQPKAAPIISQPIEIIRPKAAPIISQPIAPVVSQPIEIIQPKAAPIISQPIAPVIKQPIEIIQPKAAPIISQPIAPVVSQPIEIIQPKAAPIISRPIEIVQPKAAPIISRPIEIIQPKVAPIVSQPIAPIIRQPIQIVQPKAVPIISRPVVPRISFKKVRLIPIPRPPVLPPRAPIGKGKFSGYH